MRKILYFIISFVVIAVTACSGGSRTSDEYDQEYDINSENTERTYIVGVDATYPPFEFKNSSSGIIGFDIDLLNAIAKSQGFSFKFIHIPWNEMVQRIDGGNIDMLANGIAITDERRRTMQFSDHYLETYGVAMVPLDSKIYKLEELSGEPVAAIKNDYNISLLNDLLGKDALNLQEKDTLFLCIKALKTNEVKAVIGNVHVLRFYTNNSGDGDLREVSLSNDKNQLAFVVSKSQKDLLQQVNMGLRKIKEDGTYQTIYDKWFGSNRNS